MRVGIKLWSTNPAEYFEQAVFADFVEVLPIDRKSVGKLANIPARYAVHVPHEAFGFSPAGNYRKSKKLLDFALEVAKELKAEFVIMHTGMLTEKPTTEKLRRAIKRVAKLAKSANSDKLVIENSAMKTLFNKVERSNYLCNDYEQLKEVLELSGAGFCLDFEHAALTAELLNQPDQEVMSRLMKLKPSYLQLSGSQRGNSQRHLSIFQSDVKMNYIKQLIKKANKPVCLETPIDIEQRKKEVEFLRQ